MMKLHNLNEWGNSAWRSAIMLLVLVLAAPIAWADRPEWAGRDKDDEGERHHKRSHREGRGGDRDEDRGENRERGERYNRNNIEINRDNIQIRIGGYFDDRQRDSTREYYRERSRGGHCPPGLAKKGNGCLPPGKAREWAVGERLSRDIQYSTVEPEIRVRLGVPPAGHEFVRVASDILLIAVGTGMVVDAIQDLGQ